MIEGRWSEQYARQIVERIVIEAELVLETPAHFSSGDAEGAIMPLLVDAADGQSPLLTGASIAGALRSYLWSCERGYGHMQTSDSLTAALFGGARADDDGEQSRLIMDDAIGQPSQSIQRDGVHLNSQSRTAAHDALFAIEAWGAGTVFPLHLELLIFAQDNDSDINLLLRALAAALSGLARGEITLGARKRRGYGRVRVDQWFVRDYRFDEISGLMDWLRTGRLNSINQIPAFTDIFAALGVQNDFVDERQLFTLDALFTLDGSLLIRTYDDVDIDMIHLRDPEGRPLLSGTSIAGALRARARKIVTLLAPERADEIITDIFGSEQSTDERQLRGSRITVEEHAITLKSTLELVQNRVSIDRFTGGALDGALFTQQPVFNSAEGGVLIKLQLRQPQNHEIGLLLLLLKDLWTGDLTLGGERSVGRGRLAGLRADMQFGQQVWTIQQVDNQLQVAPDADTVGNYVTDFKQWLEEVR